MFCNLSLRRQHGPSGNSGSAHLLMRLRRICYLGNFSNWFLYFFSSLLFLQFSKFRSGSCRCNSVSCANGTYGRPDITGLPICYWGLSCRPKGAALIHTRSTYKLPLRVRGITSPVRSQMRAPATLPNRPSNPRSAQRLRLRRPLCTSATCIFMRLTSVAPSVQTRHLLSPRLGMDWPFATSYSIPLRDASDGRIGMAPAVFLGMTVSHAPESAVNSTSIHSSAGLHGLSVAFPIISMLLWV